MFPFVSGSILDIQRRGARRTKQTEKHAPESPFQNESQHPGRAPMAHSAFPLPPMRTKPESDARTHAPATCPPSARCMNRPSARSLSLPVSLVSPLPSPLRPPPERRSARPLAHHDLSSPVLRNLVPSSRGEKAVFVAFIARAMAACARGQRRPSGPRPWSDYSRARLLCRTMERMGQISPLPPLPPPPPSHVDTTDGRRGREGGPSSGGPRADEGACSLAAGLFFFLRFFLLPSKFSPFDARDVRPPARSFNVPRPLAARSRSTKGQRGAIQVPVILTLEMGQQMPFYMWCRRTMLAELLADADDGGARTGDGFHSLHRRRRKNHGGGDI